MGNQWEWRRAGLTGFADTFAPAVLVGELEFSVSSVQHRSTRLSVFLVSACFLLRPPGGGGGGSCWPLSWVEGRGVSLAAPQAVGVQLLLPSTESLSCASPCTASPLRRRPSCQSLSMSLYFLRRMDTWSLNRTGSSLIWECTSGMPPNQLANLFMQVCR